MCFVRIWEQTAIISLYSINWLVCVTETECVYCAVRAEVLTTVYAKSSILLLQATDRTTEPPAMFVQYHCPWQLAPALFKDRNLDVQ